MNENNLTHFDAAGNAVMVDVSEKPVTTREATAHGIITMNAEAFAAVQSGTVKKGDVLGVARIAGIMATKRTSELIPLCHPLPLSKLTVDFHLLPEQQAVEAVCTARTIGVTGVEMEAPHEGRRHPDAGADPRYHPERAAVCAEHCRQHAKGRLTIDQHAKSGTFSGPLPE